MFHIFLFYYLQRYDIVNGVVEAEGVTENDIGGICVVLLSTNLLYLIYRFF